MFKARSRAQGRYLKRTILIAVFYMAAVAAATFLIDRQAPAGAFTILLAGLPGLAVAALFWSLGRLIVEEQDEFVRMLIVRQSLIATGFALSLASVWGFLESFEIVAHIDSYWVAILWFGGLGLGAVVNKIQFGTFGECA